MENQYKREINGNRLFVVPRLVKLAAAAAPKSNARREPSVLL